MIEKIDELKDKKLISIDEHRAYVKIYNEYANYKEVEIDFDDLTEITGIDELEMIEKILTDMEAFKIFKAVDFEHGIIVPFNP